jgi:hypothetical protein
MEVEHVTFSIHNMQDKVKSYMSEEKSKECAQRLGLAAIGEKKARKRETAKTPEEAQKPASNRYARDGMGGLVVD